MVIDVTNPLSAWPRLETRCWSHGGTSGGELLQSKLPRSFVFKAFNTIGASWARLGKASGLHFRENSGSLFGVWGAEGWPCNAPGGDGGAPANRCQPSATPGKVAASTQRLCMHAGVEKMEDSRVAGQQISMMFAGDARDRVPLVSRIVADVGFVPEYIGGIRYARQGCWFK